MTIINNSKMIMKVGRIVIFPGQSKIVNRANWADMVAMNEEFEDGLIKGQIIAVDDGTVPAVEYEDYLGEPTEDKMALVSTAEGVRSWSKAIEGNNADAILDAFNIGVEKNLYNPALAEDGKLYRYTTGDADPYPNSIITGKIPVTEGKTYTLWMSPLETKGFFGYISCWGAGGTYLGMNAIVPGSTNTLVVANMNLIKADPVSIGYRKLTFTIPEGSGVAFIGTLMLYNYAVHTTADFNRIRLATQMELGIYSTEFSAYTGKYVASLKNASNYTVASETMLLIIRNPDCYIRTRWDATRYLVQKLTYNATEDYANNCTNFHSARLIPIVIGETDTVAAYGAGEVLASQTADDNCPIKYGGTYMGANHGALIVSVTATTHGKTVADIGEEWRDSGNKVWYIIRIVDVNTIWMMSANIASYPVWSFYSTMAAGNLTKAGEADIVVTARAGAQLLPSIQGLTKNITINGIDIVSADGIYQCKSVEINEGYDILNPAAVLNYILAHPGVEASFDDAGITAKDLRFDISYQYSQNGACTVYHNVYAYRALALNYAGMVQATVISFDSEVLEQTLHQYIPGDSVLAATADISGTIAQIDSASATWIDANNPPSRFAQIVKDSNGDNEFGFTLGYSLLRGITVPAIRKDVNSAGFIFTSKKQYPYATDDGIYATLPANTLLEAVAYRSYYPCGDATVMTWYKEGGDYIVVIDYHQTVSQLGIQLPPFMVGKTLTVVEKHDNLTLHTGAFVSASGIRISVANNYGFIILKIN